MSEQSDIRHTPAWPTEGLSFGGDYNPEQWDWDVILEDVALMREAKVNLVTVGVFSWVVHEPSDGRFDFAWLDRLLDLLDEHGIGVDLATPTAAPPMWLQHAHPEILPADEWGRRRAPGGRLGWCPSSPVFREYALRVVDQLATHVAGHPAVRMWHVSNELGGGNGRCQCPASNDAFRGWLRARYGSIDAVNAAWSTAFWGNSFSAFDEVVTPMGGTNHNPAHELDFERFSSDALLEHYRAERRVLEQHTPGIPITTNFMVGLGPDVVDYARWAPEMDVVANDHYTQGPDPLRHQDLAFSGDRMRGISNGGPWMLLEHATGGSSWHPVNQPKGPGEMVRHAIGHLARGSDSVMFFQWRASRGGIEQFHSAMLPHAGAESQMFRDIVRLGDLMERLSVIRGTRVVGARVAMLFDNEAGWALRSGLKPNNRIGYSDVSRAIHHTLMMSGVTVDVVPPWADLADYDVVIVPGLFLVSDASADALRDFVAAGGHALVTWFSGIVDEHNTVRLGGYPGAFRELIGAWSEQFHPLADGEVATLDDGSTVHRWSELLHPDGASVVLRYATGAMAGHPAVTRNDYGRGAAWYLSTELDEAGLTGLLGSLLREAGVEPAASAAEDVEVVRRGDERGSFLFAINHRDDDGWVEARGRDLISQTEVDGRLVLSPGQVAVIASPSPLA